jgi:hypothetical protein
VLIAVATSVYASYLYNELLSSKPLFDPEIIGRVLFQYEYGSPPEIESFNYRLSQAIGASGLIFDKDHIERLDELIWLNTMYNLATNKEKRGLSEKEVSIYLDVNTNTNRILNRYNVNVESLFCMACVPTNNILKYEDILRINNSLLSEHLRIAVGPLEAISDGELGDLKNIILSISDDDISGGDQFKLASLGQLISFIEKKSDTHNNYIAHDLAVLRLIGFLQLAFMNVDIENVLYSVESERNPEYGQAKELHQRLMNISLSHNFFRLLRNLHYKYEILRIEELDYLVNVLGQDNFAGRATIIIQALSNCIRVDDIEEYNKIFSYFDSQVDHIVDGATNQVDHFYVGILKLMIEINSFFSTGSYPFELDEKIAEVFRSADGENQMKRHCLLSMMHFNGDIEIIERLWGEGVLSEQEYSRINVRPSSNLKYFLYPLEVYPNDIVMKSILKLPIPKHLFGHYLTRDFSSRMVKLRANE